MLIFKYMTKHICYMPFATFAGGLPSILRRAVKHPPDKRKEGDDNGYIF